MRRSTFFSSLPLLLVFINASCTTHTGMISYPDYSSEMIISAAPIEGAQELGVVTTDVGGSIFDNCDDRARLALDELVLKAKNLNANAIGGIRWLHDEVQERASPTCRKQWGWFALFPAVFSPWFMKVSGMATAYRVKSGRRQ